MNFRTDFQTDFRMDFQIDQLIIDSCPSPSLFDSGLKGEFIRIFFKNSNNLDKIGNSWLERKKGENIIKKCIFPQSAINMECEYD